ncbi:insulin-like growth factor-binding protein 2 [Xenopus laevis]|uniref:Insulin-like growth factor-binding protein 2 n=2 Tax=Xenopus laevis TaxID=8355 RepID=IBP2_XENLA|nr:insulin-like growth factor-binding protein 2 [Xenopus laevis]Q5XHC5.1 RecName: Full=Insulin-like growth factor-binding protein 2; Short=IGF-binding protein 2; Short=IGFBP-2; Flags: Precursor [Xenopus laevis]AAH84133.1 LOC495038 protein [synthetic construct]
MVLSEHLLVLLGAVLCAPALSDVLFRCPPCSPERLAACPGNSPRSPCAELVRAPGCGCCPVCARLEGESCGVYTARCAGGLRCYPHPGSELPLQALVLGLGTCGKRRDAEYGSSQERGTELPEDQSDNMLVDNNLVAGPAVPGDFMPRKSSKAHAVNRERANEQHRSKTNKSEDKKRPARSLCQLQLDQVLERISGMHLPDDRGPLEHLYALPIPNCDKNGFFNLKQCKMSVNGQRGECWCVNPITGKVLPGSPTVRGDPECHLFYTNPEEERRAHTQRAP